MTGCYRPLFRKAVDRFGPVSVFYADDTSWKGRPSWADDGLANWEVYLDKADPGDASVVQNLNPDVVFVVTPDFTHSEIASGWVARKALTIFVEKPFDTQVANVDALLMEMGRSPGSAVLGLDHYQFYGLPILQRIEQIDRHLGSALTRVDFFLVEEHPIESGRERSLQFGLGLDLLPHALALLTYFGDVRTIDEIEVIAAGQYEPLVARARDDDHAHDISAVFRRETFASLQFTFEDYSGTGRRVPVYCTVGKGTSRNVKYLEVTGVTGRAIRLDLSTGAGDREADYPWDSLFFLNGPESGPDTIEVPDPYSARRLHILHDAADEGRFRAPTARDRYLALMQDLIRGRGEGVAGALLLTEAREIVGVLDRISRAIQGEEPRWMRYRIGELDAVAVHTGGSANLALERTTNE